MVIVRCIQAKAAATQLDGAIRQYAIELNLVR